MCVFACVSMRTHVSFRSLGLTLMFIRARVTYPFTASFPFIPCDATQVPCLPLPSLVAPSKPISSASPAHESPRPHPAASSARPCVMPNIAWQILHNKPRFVSRDFGRVSYTRAEGGPVEKLKYSRGSCERFIRPASARTKIFGFKNSSIPPPLSLSLCLTIYRSIYFSI